MANDTPPPPNDLPPNDVVLSVRPLGFPWETADPFLFCVHHLDAYPKGNGKLGPAASLAGRAIGQDFAGRDGWNMYHGDEVPGFPQHPHRGFETVTVVRRGLVDHADSMGATARYGGGDVQWLTAGRGMVHAEMFPLVREDADNPLELFQIWLNLPRADKLVEPHFEMLWSERVPRRVLRDAEGREIEVTVVAGPFPLDEGEALVPPPPPPRSWAARPESAVVIWTLALAPHARVTLPRGEPGHTRTLYFFRGDTLHVAGQALPRGVAARVRPDATIELVGGEAPSEVLVLGGRPIGEPVTAYGPFVMNTPAEIQQAFMDYRRDGFGGWPWPSDGPVHGADAGRFAKRPDGKIERPPG